MRYALLLAVFLVCNVAHARERIWGFCSEGATTLTVGGVGTIPIQVQAVYPQCVVTVYQTGTFNRATVYQDNQTPATGLANPFTASGTAPGGAPNGYWSFYVAGGRYDIRVSGGNPAPGIVPGYTYPDILVCDPLGPNPDLTCGGSATAGNHDLLSTTHPDTIPYTPPVRGDIITAQNLTSPTGVTPAWARLALGANATVLTSNGTDALWQPLPALGGGACSGIVQAGTICAGPPPVDGSLAVTRIQANASSQTTTGQTTLPFFGPTQGSTAVPHQILAISVTTCTYTPCGGPGAGNATVTDSQGNTYSYVTGASQAYTAYVIYEATTTQNAPDTITMVDHSGNSTFGMIMAEYENLGGTDGAPVGANTNINGAPAVSISFTTGHDQDILIGLGNIITGNSNAIVSLSTAANWNQVPPTPLQICGPGTCSIEHELSDSFAAYAGSYTLGFNCTVIGAGGGACITGFNGQTAAIIFPFQTSNHNNLSGPMIPRYLPPTGASFLIANTGTTNNGDLACVTANGYMASCSPSAPNMKSMGVIQYHGGSQASVQQSGISQVNSSASVVFTQGDWVCTDAANPGTGLVVDGGAGTGCLSGKPLGVVLNTDSAASTQHTAVLGWFGGAGGVSSVGLGMPGEFSVANSPITGAGTLIVTKAIQQPNTFWAGPASAGAGNIVQVTYCTFAGSATSNACTFTSNTSAGNMGILVMTQGNDLGNGHTALSDTQSNTWTINVPTSGSAQVILASTCNMAGGADTVTAVANNGATRPSMALIEVSGGPTTACFDSATAAYNTLTSGAVTQAKELIIGGINSMNANQTVSVGSGYTLQAGTNPISYGSAGWTITQNATTGLSGAQTVNATVSCPSCGVGAAYAVGGFKLTNTGAAQPTFRSIGMADLPILAGTTGSIGGSALAAGACASGTATVSGATNGMAAMASPVNDPGANNLSVYSFVSAVNTVTVRVCAIAAATPVATSYNVRVF